MCAFAFCMCVCVCVCVQLHFVCVRACVCVCVCSCDECNTLTSMGSPKVLAGERRRRRQFMNRCLVMDWQRWTLHDRDLSQLIESECLCAAAGERTNPWSREEGRRREKFARAEEPCGHFDSGSQV